MAPSATIPGRSLLIGASSPAEARGAIDSAYSTVEHGQIGTSGGALRTIGNKVAELPRFSRVLQDFHGGLSGGKGGFVCYSSVNQLLEPRPGGD
jgi:hypothetical protein